MTEHKHTPGPWTWETESGEWPDHNLIGGYGDSVMWWDFDLGFRFENEANARLIAAAPDMLEALQAMYRAHHLHIFSPLGQKTHSDRDTCRICGGNYRNTLQHIMSQEGHPSDVKAEAERLARAAIAKAKGRLR